MVRIDMHVHSSASFDCDVPPQAVARRLKSYGIAPVFLTDHDTLSGALELRDRGAERVVVGQEITTTQGELIGLFLTAHVPPGLDPEQAVERIKAQGGLVYLQHPYDARRRALSERAVERIRDSIDIVEVFNGRSTAGANRLAEDLCDVLRALPGAGSDAHALDQIGRVYVEMDNFTGPWDFLSKLGAGRIVQQPRRWQMRLDATLRAGTQQLH